LSSGRQGMRPATPDIMEVPMTRLPLNVDQVLTTTRSVRKRLDLQRPVDRQIIVDCLEIAFQAPNGSNMNTWQWLVVDDATVLAEVARIYRAAMDDFVASLGDAVGDNYQGAHIPGFEQISASVDYLREHLHQVPAVVLPLMAGRTDGLSLFYQASQWGSILQAVWSFFLALRVRGLGSAWTTAHLVREREMAQLLGIPAEHYTQVGLFPVAYTLGTEFRPAWRKPAAEVVSWNQFGNREQ